MCCCLVVMHDVITVIQTCIDLLESVLEIWVFFSWAKLSSTLFFFFKTMNCEKMKKAKGQLVQTRNHLQKASVPADRALWCTHREVQHACFIAGWVETEALKAEFQMTTWETETRGSEEFNGLLVRKMPWCVCVQFHVQLCLCSLDDISDSKEPDKISPVCFYVGCCRWFLCS